MNSLYVPRKRNWFQSQKRTVPIKTNLANAGSFLTNGIKCISRVKLRVLEEAFRERDQEDTGILNIEGLHEALLDVGVSDDLIRESLNLACDEFVVGFDDNEMLTFSWKPYARKLAKALVSYSFTKSAESMNLIDEELEELNNKTLESQQPKLKRAKKQQTKKRNNKRSKSDSTRDQTKQSFNSRMEFLHQKLKREQRKENKMLSSFDNYLTEIANYSLSNSLVQPMPELSAHTTYRSAYLTGLQKLDRTATNMMNRTKLWALNVWQRNSKIVKHQKAGQQQMREAACNTIFGHLILIHQRKLKNVINVWQEKVSDVKIAEIMWAVLVFQKFTRGYFDRKRVRRIRQEKTATKLQAWYKCHTLRKSYERRKLCDNAALILQCAFRKKIANKRVTYLQTIKKQQFAAQTIQVRWRYKHQLRERLFLHQVIIAQSLWRRKKATERVEIRRKEFSEQTRVAIKLQALARGMLCRKHIQEGKEYKAAVFIQSYARMFLCRDALEDRKHEIFQNECAKIMQRWWRHILWKKSRVDGATKIQAFIRAEKIRRKLRYQHSQATQIQRIWRGKAARQQIRRDASAARIQAIFKGNLSRRWWILQKGAVAVLQSFFKASLFHKHRNDACIKLQSLHRGRIARQEIKKQQNAASSIQSIWKKQKTQKIFMEKRSNASIKIQTQWRGHMQRVKYANILESIIKIQSIMRGCLTRRRVGEMLLRRDEEKDRQERQAAVRIQARIRGQQCRLELQRQEDAALKLQSLLRGNKARKEVQKRREEFAEAEAEALQYVQTNLPDATVTTSATAEDSTIPTDFDFSGLSPEEIEKITKEVIDEGFDDEEFLSSDDDNDNNNVDNTDENDNQEEAETIKESNSMSINDGDSNSSAEANTIDKVDTNEEESETHKNNSTSITPIKEDDSIIDEGANSDTIEKANTNKENNSDSIIPIKEENSIRDEQILCSGDNNITNDSDNMNEETDVATTIGGEDSSVLTPVEEVKPVVDSTIHEKDNNDAEVNNEKIDNEDNKDVTNSNSDDTVKESSVTSVSNEDSDINNNSNEDINTDDTSDKHQIIEGDVATAQDISITNDSNNNNDDETKEQVSSPIEPMDQSTDDSIQTHNSKSEETVGNVQEGEDSSIEVTKSNEQVKSDDIKSEEKPVIEVDIEKMEASTEKGIQQDNEESNASPSELIKSGNTQEEVSEEIIHENLNLKPVTDDQNVNSNMDTPEDNEDEKKTDVHEEETDTVTTKSEVDLVDMDDNDAVNLLESKTESSPTHIEQKDKLEKERLLKEQQQEEDAKRLEADRLVEEDSKKAEIERLAKEEEEAKVEAERLEAEKLAKTEADRLAKEAADRLEAERLAKEEAMRLAEEEKIVEQEKAAKLEAEKLADEQRKKDEKAEAERIEAERIESERIAAEKSEAECIAAEKAEAERLESERMEAERIAKEEADRIETERIAVEKAKAEAEELAKKEAQILEDERLAMELANKKAAEEEAKQQREREESEAQLEREKEIERLAEETANKLAAKMALVQIAEEKEEAERVAIEKEKQQKEMEEMEENEILSKNSEINESDSIKESVETVDVENDKPTIDEIKSEQKEPAKELNNTESVADSNLTVQKSESVAEADSNTNDKNDVQEDDSADADSKISNEQISLDKEKDQQDQIKPKEIQQEQETKRDNIVPNDDVATTSPSSSESLPPPPIAKSVSFKTEDDVVAVTNDDAGDSDKNNSNEATNDNNNDQTIDANSTSKQDGESSRKDRKRDESPSKPRRSKSKSHKSSKKKRRGLERSKSRRGKRKGDKRTRDKSGKSGDGSVPSGKKKIKRRELRASAAVKIQRVYVKFIVHKKLTIRSATNIQCLFRCFQAKKKLAKLRLDHYNKTRCDAATVIQAHFRGFLVMRKYGHILARKRAERWLARRNQDASTCIQKAFRAYLQRQEDTRIRRENGALDIQCWWRCTLARAHVSHIRSIKVAEMERHEEEKNDDVNLDELRQEQARIMAAMRIQCLFKQKRAQKLLAGLKAEKRLRSIETGMPAVETVQRWWRGCIGRKMISLLRTNYMDRFKHYVDENSGLPYIYDSQTGETKWDVPDPNKPLCEECGKNPVRRFCEDCEINVCGVCWAVGHEVRKHEWLYPHGEWCEVCASASAVKKCNQCDKFHCDRCYQVAHTNHQQDHTFRRVAPSDEEPPFCSVCKSLAATHQCDQTYELYCQNCWSTASYGTDWTYTEIILPEWAGDTWYEYTDDNTGTAYFYNPYTGASSWTNPKLDQQQQQQQLANQSYGQQQYQEQQSQPQHMLAYQAY